MAQADLTQPGSFDEAVRGATFVFHTASPFVMNVPHGAERELLIEPAVRGTENIIGARPAQDQAPYLGPRLDVFDCACHKYQQQASSLPATPGPNLIAPGPLLRCVRL